MLVLSRSTGEGVTITKGGEVIAKLTIVRLKSDKVRLGFEAGENVLIHRNEVQERIDRGEPIKHRNGEVVI